MYEFVFFSLHFAQKFDADNDRLNGSKVLTSEVMNPPYFFGNTPNLDQTL